MPVLTWATHHRLLALGLGITVVVAMLALGIWFLVFRSPVTQVDLSQALRLYRQNQRPGTSARDARLPPPGVYRYRTSGSEQLSVGGITRTFPSETELVVTDARCATMEWEPFEQHIEGLVECPVAGGALSIESAPTYEEIAGTQSTTDIRCPSDAYLVPPVPTIGERWKATCTSTGTSVSFAGQIIGTSTVTVGDQRVPALHVRVSLVLSGAESGSNPSDYWLSAQSGVVLRQRETVDLRQQSGPLGAVRYSEAMTITLDSLTPAH
jgi:hypothetical protein